MLSRSDSSSLKTGMTAGSASFSIYRCAQNFYARCFDRYGRFVSRCPIPFIVVPVLTFGLLGLGLLYQDNETDIERLYTPINSRAAQDREKVKAMFPDMTGKNYNTYSLNTENRYGELLVIADGNIFSNDSITEIRALVERIKEFQIEKENTTVRYFDVCARNKGACVVSGQIFLTEDFLLSLSKGNVTFPIWNNMDISFSMAKVNLEGSTLLSASIIKLTFNLRQDGEMKKKYSLLWEDKFIKEMKNHTLKTANITFATSQSLGDELNDNTNGDVFWFSLSFTLLTTYASLVCGGDCVASTSHLARAGVLAAGLSVLGALGFISLCGVKFVNIVGIMPFLVLAIGVDDMFLMLSAWADTNQYGNDIPKRVGLTFRLAGVGITITSLTDFCAFAMGYTSVFLSVKNFCIYTGTAILFCYLAQVTFFAGCLALHGRRVESSRHCITCRKISPKDTPQRKSCLFNCFCTGEPPRTRNDSFFGKLLPLFLNKYLLTLPGKFLTLTAFAVYLGISAWGVTKLQQGLLLNNLVPPSSYYNTYVITNYKYFGARIPVAFIFEKDIDYSQEIMLSRIEGFIAEIQEDPFLDSGTLICWLNAFRSTPLFNMTNSSTFVHNIDLFLKNYSHFQNDVVFDSKRQVITATRCYILSVNVPDSVDQAELMIRSRAVADKSLLPVFAYHPLFIYFEQFVSVLPTILQTVGIAVAVMVFITMVFLPHPLIVVLVLVNIVLIVTGVFGFMAFWGLSLSSITMIHLIMSVGFSVDFTVHVCSAYMLAEGTTRNERARNAIVHAAGPVFNAGLSTFIGIVTLVASQSYVFQSFFRIMVLVILFGLSTAVFFLPVVLSLIGPLRVNTEDRPLGATSDNTSVSETSMTTSVSAISHYIDIHGKEIPLGVEFTCPEVPNKVMVKM